MAAPSLTHEQVHAIRTAGLPDTHWRNKLNVRVGVIWSARTGATFKSHPTPPDKAKRPFARPNVLRDRELVPDFLPREVWADLARRPWRVSA